MSEQKHYEPNMYAIATSSKNNTCKRKTQSPPSPPYRTSIRKMNGKISFGWLFERNFVDQHHEKKYTPV